MAWNIHPRHGLKKITKSVHKMGYIQSQGHHTMFYKHVEGDKIMILIIYVDDKF